MKKMRSRLLLANTLATAFILGMILLTSRPAMALCGNDYLTAARTTLNQIQSSLPSSSENLNERSKLLDEVQNQATRARIGCPEYTQAEKNRNAGAINALRATAALLTAQDYRWLKDVPGFKDGAICEPYYRAAQRFEVAYLWLQHFGLTTPLGPIRPPFMSSDNMESYYSNLDPASKPTQAAYQHAAGIIGVRLPARTASFERFRSSIKPYAKAAAALEAHLPQGVDCTYGPYTNLHILISIPSFFLQ